MNDQININPHGEKQPYIFDFSPYLTSDESLAQIGSGSEIKAYSSAGKDVSGEILTNKSQTGMLLSVDIGNVKEGEEYRVEFIGQGQPSTNVFTLVLGVFSRIYIQGGF